MGTYATQSQIVAALAAHPDVQVPGGDALEQLIAGAERAVDRRLGPYPVDPVTGAKLAPELLTVAQRAALVAAVAVGVGHAILADGEETFGGDDYLPNLISRVSGDGLGARIDSELAGHALLARSGCALPDPLPVRSVLPLT